jgi:hypothetical protein
MSRTIRRKNSHREQWALRDHIESQSLYGGHYWKPVLLEKGTREYEAAWWHFHRDRQQGQMGVPKYFRVHFVRRTRRKEEQALLRELGRGQLDVVFNRRVRDAAYAWF